MYTIIIFIRGKLWDILRTGKVAFSIKSNRKLILVRVMVRLVTGFLSIAYIDKFHVVTRQNKWSLMLNKHCLIIKGTYLVNQYTTY